MRALIGVELLRKLPAGPVDVRDVKLPGFVLRVRPSGTHSYYATWTPRTGKPGKRRVARWYPLGTTAVLEAPEAREAARKVLADVARGDDPIEARKIEAQRITFEAFVTDHYTPWATAQRKTGAEQVARLTRTFGDTLNGLRLDEIGPFHIERWRSARLKDGIEPSTVNRDLAVLRGALSRAVEWGLLSVHPLARVKASQTDRGSVVRYLSPDEESRLLKALAARDETRREERRRANTWRRERGYRAWPEYGVYTDHLHPLVLLALHTGLRRGELFALRWADVDLVGARLTVRGEKAKSGQTRHVPLNTTAVSTLTTWRSCVKPKAPTALVFPGVDGAPLTDIKTSWLALVKAAGIADFRFHDCRHTFASKLVMRGIDLNTTRELLGHADLKMTLRYAHMAPEHKAAAVAKLVAV